MVTKVCMICKKQFESEQLKTCDACREYHREWRAANREHVREYTRAWFDARPGYRHAWDVANPEKRREIDRRWTAEHPEKSREKQRRMYDRRYANKLTALVRDNFTCQECGSQLSRGRPRDTPNAANVHHIDYTSDEPENLISLCVSCHRKVHNNASVVSG